MSNDILSQMLSRYEIHNVTDQHNALHEVLQQMILSGLHRAGFFDVAAFYGGTFLRIFHGLSRFSEDMDFSLLAPDENFALERYFPAIVDEFKIIDCDVTIQKKVKRVQSNIESAFLKDDTAIYDLGFNTGQRVKIKIEVDTKPPLLFSTEYKLLLLPYSLMVRCYKLPDAFAGKMNALLFRGWKNRIKGRDWYDFEWYVRNDIPINFEHFCERLHQFGQADEDQMTKELFLHLLQEKIQQSDIEKIKADVKPFISNISEMNIWSTEYFLELSKMIRFT
jgi:predicted nucleotidyltransferase component of viral defense system